MFHQAHVCAGPGHLLLVLLLVVTACSPAANRRDDEPSLREEIDTALDAQLDAGPAMRDVRAVLVAADGTLVYERYAESTADDYHPIQSVTKSIVSTLVGIAVADGDLALDDVLGDLLPDYRDRMSAPVAGVTLRQLLTMTAGMVEAGTAADQAWRGSADPVAAALATSTGPTGRFTYSNAAAHVVAAVLVEATGSSVLELARTRLFTPLGIPAGAVAEPTFRPRPGQRAAVEYDRAAMVWPVDVQGLHLGWGFVKLRPQDLLTLGQLYLDRGVWEGRRILPREWVEDATKAHLPSGAEVRGGLAYYGYLWWVGEMDGTPAYAAVGDGGQLVMVVPDRGLVVVTAVDLRLSDPSSHGVSEGSMAYLVETALLRPLAG